ncbi:hypothetical protein EVG20_g9552 [Dentipellis fragilis]|uniref:Uncharacterized protein n=1 Tax=Dentipellis fragilis TaxID=205917 RepID=A0A4Y9XXJ6_9AGAM|nr:hypothetical protein EVG20_g9552 [Dentipellis fragilis]
MAPKPRPVHTDSVKGPAAANPPSGLATRSTNKQKHPGAIDAPAPRRSSAQVAADKKAQADLAADHVQTRQAAHQRLRDYEAQLGLDEEEQDKIANHPPACVLRPCGAPASKLPVVVRTEKQDSVKEVGRTTKAASKANKQKAVQHQGEDDQPVDQVLAGEKAFPKEGGSKKRERAATISGQNNCAAKKPTNKKATSANIGGLTNPNRWKPSVTTTPVAAAAPHDSLDLPTHLFDKTDEPTFRHVALPIVRIQSVPTQETLDGMTAHPLEEENETWEGDTQSLCSEHDEGSEVCMDIDEGEIDLQIEESERGSEFGDDDEPMGVTDDQRAPLPPAVHHPSQQLSVRDDHSSARKSLASVTPAVSARVSVPPKSASQLVAMTVLVKPMSSKPKPKPKPKNVKVELISEQDSGENSKLPKKRMTLSTSDVPGAFRERFHTILVPLVKQYTATLNAWENPNVEAVQTLFNSVIPNIPYTISSDEVVYKLLIQRVAEWRSRIGARALKGLPMVFSSEGYTTSEEAQQYAEWALYSPNNRNLLLRTLRVLETERSEVVLRLHLRAKGLAYEALAIAEGE